MLPQHGDLPRSRCNQSCFGENMNHTLWNCLQPVFQLQRLITATVTKCHVVESDLKRIIFLKQRRSVWHMATAQAQLHLLFFGRVMELHHNSTAQVCTSNYLEQIRSRKSALKNNLSEFENLLTITIEWRNSIQTCLREYVCIEIVKVWVINWPTQCWNTRSQ